MCACTLPILVIASLLFICFIHFICLLFTPCTFSPPCPSRLSPSLYPASPHQGSTSAKVVYPNDGGHPDELSQTTTSTACSGTSMASPHLAPAKNIPVSSTHLCPRVVKIDPSLDDLAYHENTGQFNATFRILIRKKKTYNMNLGFPLSPVWNSIVRPVKELNISIQLIGQNIIRLKLMNHCSLC